VPGKNILHRLEIIEGKTAIHVFIANEIIKDSLLEQQRRKWGLGLYWKLRAISPKISTLRTIPMIFPASAIGIASKSRSSMIRITSNNF
jgi:hypothetical protein